MISSLEKVAVIVAHPDDEVLGCGGTIRKLTQRGFIVDILILGEGITSRNKRRDVNADKSSIKELQRICRKANKLLGTRSVTLKDFPDNRFDSIDLLDIIKEIEEFIQDKRPEGVLTHHRGDLNIDHQITNRAVLTACRPTSIWSPDCIMTFDVLSATEWFFGAREKIFSPNVFIDIEEELESKIKALLCYTTENRPFPFPRSKEALEHQAMRYGAISNQKASEAFELLYCREK